MNETYTVFGEFLLLKRRTQDGLGSLWRAGEMDRTGFKRIVWLRRFDQTGLDRAALEAEAATVAQVAQALKATNIVRNSKFGVEDGVAYMAYDFVPGQPLDNLLERVGSDQFPVPIDNALLIAEKIAAALSAALAFDMQGQPLVHGFLVPELIMVGNDGEAMVSGFGLARGLLANLDRVSVQEMAAPYLAPEVLTTQSTSRRADVFSLGSILYQLLCGEVLPSDPARRATALSAPRLADDDPVPEDVLAILRRALAERPEERYSSAVDFKRDLEKLLYGGAYSPTTFNLALFMDRLYRQEIEEEDRDLQRERTIDVSPYYRPPKQAAEAAAGAATSTSRTGLYAALGVVAVLLLVVAYLLFFRAPAASQQNVADLIQTEVARQLAEKEAQLQSELNREKQETEKLRQQLAQQQDAPAAKVTEAEKKKQEELRQQIAAREAEQKKREEELRKLQEQRAKAQAEAKPEAVPTLAVAAKATNPPSSSVTVAATRPTVAPVAVPTAVPTAAPIVPTAAPAEPQVAKVKAGDFVEFTKVDTPPEVLVTEKPKLTRAAEVARARGTVILSVLVNERGGVDDVKVLRGATATNLGIDEACTEAARKYRFRPATKDGVNVKTWATVTFQIDLSRGR